ncbi:MAG: Clp protease ClpP [Bacteroidales bacterium]|nr:Clp protease ClpP [Bacteroidales bacterium]
MRIDVKGTIVSNNDKWIYEWFEYDATCPNDVIKAIGQANGEPLEVYINSGGGDIFAGSEIYSALQSYKGEVNIHVVGFAASAASVIACAGKSDITPTAMVMVHNVSGGARGDYHVMDKNSNILQIANKSIAAAYMAKTGMSEKDALTMMDQETWLTAQQAVDKGLIDKIAENQNLKLVASYQTLMIPQSVIDKVRNTIKGPLNEAGILTPEKAQAKLNLLKLGGTR